jgi:hypothetical protein
MWCAPFCGFANNSDYQASTSPAIVVLDVSSLLLERELFESNETGNAPLQHKTGEGAYFNEKG